MFVWWEWVAGMGWVFQETSCSSKFLDWLHNYMCVYIYMYPFFLSGPTCDDGMSLLRLGDIIWQQGRDSAGVIKIPNELILSYSGIALCGPDLIR